MKKTLLTVLLVAFATLSLAQPQISNVDISPSSPQVGEQVEITASSNSYGDYYIQAKYPGHTSEWDSRDCSGQFYGCDTADTAGGPWTFTPESPGTFDVDIRAREGLETSTVIERSITVDSATQQHRLTVEVEDQEGNSLSNVEVTVDGQTRETTGFGNAYFDLSNGQYTVEASGSQGTATRDIEISGEDKTITLVLGEESQTNRLTVSVEDQNSNAVADAEVTVDGNTKLTTGFGNAYFDLTNGDYTVQVSKDGYDDVSKPVTISGEDKSITVTLGQERSQRHRLTVSVENQEGERISDAEVTVNGNTKLTTGFGNAYFDLTNGDYTVQVSKDGYDDVSKPVTISGEDKTVEITLRDKSGPTASFTVSPENPTTATTISFDAGDSSDDNGITNYKWSFGDGSESSGSQVTHRYDSPGEYTVQLEVTDTAGQTATTTKTVKVDAAPSECGITQDSMHLSASKTLIRETESTTLRLRVTNLGDENQRIDYRLTLGGETVETGSRTVPAGGTQEVTETVSPSQDVYARAHVSTNGGNCGSRDFQTLNEEISVVVSDGREDTRPEAEFTYSPQNPTTGEEVTFDAGPSSDDNGIVSYNWSFGQGSISSGETATYSFNDKGTYPVTLTVKDTSGQKDSRLRYVTVGEPERTCGVSSRNIQLTLDEYAIDSGESTSAKVRVFNTASHSQRVRVKLKAGSDVIENTVVTVPGFGSRTVSRTVSPDRDTYIRARVSTLDGPCGDRTFPLKNKELYVNSGETAEEASLEIDIEKKGGTPLRNAEVSVSGPEDLTRFTDSRGKTEFSLKPGHYSVEVSHPDYNAEEKSVRLYAGDDEELRFQLGGLEGEGRLNVQVVDSDGDQIEDARVEVQNGDYTVKRTDSYGEVDFSLETGSYQVEASHPDYESTDTATVEIEKGETTYKTLRLYKDETGGEKGIEVASTDYPETVCRGETLSVDVKVRNNADRDEYVSVTGTGLGSIKVLDSFILEEGESETKTVRFTNVKGSGTGTFRIEARNGTMDEVSRTVKVESCGYTPPENGGTVSKPEGISMKLSYPVAPNKAIVGDTVKVSGFVDGVNRRTEVEIEVNGERKARVSTQPDGYYQTFITVDEVGMKTVTAKAGGESASREIQVLPSASTGVLKTPRKVFEGQTFQACTQVTSPIKAKVVLLEDGTPIKSTNANGEVCFDVKAPKPGEHVYEVRALTSGTSGSSRSIVHVLKSDVEVESFPGQVASVESGSGQIKVELYNTHDEEMRYNLKLKGLPETWTSQTSKQVVLTKGEKKTVYFYLTPREEGSFTPELKVEADNQLIYNEEVPLETQGQKEPRQKGFLSVLNSFLPF